MKDMYKHQVITKASSSQKNNEEPTFYGYVYSAEHDGKHHKERFVDFKDLSQFNAHVDTLYNDTIDDQYISVFDALKKDFPIQKSTPYIRLNTKKKDPKKIKGKKAKKSKSGKKTKKMKLQKINKKHTKKKK